MTDKEILIKAMAIAKRNGYDIGDDFFTEIPTEFYLLNGMDLYYSLIFDHGFAKAFWEDDWVYHLQEMVLETRPIDYIYKFIPDEK